MNILIASTTFEDEPEAYQYLEDAGFSYVNATRDIRKSWTSIDFIENLKDKDGIIIGGEYEITGEVLKAGNNLKVVSLNCNGYNNIDISAATDQGVVVCNTPGINNTTVADFIWGQILSLVRQIVKADKGIRAGQWVTEGVEKSHGITGKTLGIIGMGSIGQEVVRRARGFDMNILYNVRNRKVALEETLGLKFASKDELFKKADILVLCCPLNEETRNLINQDVLKKMKPISYLVNSMRGGIVNEDDLFQALQEGWIAGAALDVYQEEPLYQSKFFKLDNVVLTPHMAGLVDSSIKAAAVGAARNLIKVLKGEKGASILNPQVLK